MLKPDFPKKGIGEEKKEGRNGKKEKEKDENKKTKIIFQPFMYEY